jgi:hypothetical protein
MIWFFLIVFSLVACDSTKNSGYNDGWIYDNLATLKTKSTSDRELLGAFERVGDDFFVQRSDNVMLTKKEGGVWSVFELPTNDPVYDIFTHENKLFIGTSNYGEVWSYNPSTLKWTNHLKLSDSIQFVNDSLGYYVYGFTVYKGKIILPIGKHNSWESFALIQGKSLGVWDTLPHGETWPYQEENLGDNDFFKDGIEFNGELYLETYGKGVVKYNFEMGYKPLEIPPDYWNANGSGDTITHKYWYFKDLHIHKEKLFAVAGDAVFSYENEKWVHNSKFYLADRETNIYDGYDLITYKEALVKCGSSGPIPQVNIPGTKEWFTLEPDSWRPADSPSDSNYTEFGHTASYSMSIYNDTLYTLNGFKMMKIPTWYIDSLLSWYDGREWISRGEYRMPNGTTIEDSWPWNYKEND